MRERISKKKNNFNTGETNLKREVIIRKERNNF